MLLDPGAGLSRTGSTTCCRSSSPGPDGEGERRDALVHARARGRAHGRSHRGSGCSRSGQAGGGLAPRGLRAAVAGTHPFAVGEDTEVSESARYQVLYEKMRELRPGAGVRAPRARGRPRPRARDAGRRPHQGPPAAHPRRICELAVLARPRQRHGVVPDPALPGLSALGHAPALRRLRGLPRRLSTSCCAPRLPGPRSSGGTCACSPASAPVEVRIADAPDDRLGDGGHRGADPGARRLEATEGHAPPELVGAAGTLEENRFLAARDGMSTWRPLRACPRAGSSSSSSGVRPHSDDLGSRAELDELRTLMESPRAARQRAIANEAGQRGLVEWLASAFLEAGAIEAGLGDRGRRRGPGARVVASVGARRDRRGRGARAGSRARGSRRARAPSACVRRP